MKTKNTSSALRLLEKIHRGKPGMKGLIEQERANLDVARKIIAARTEAGLSQAALAAKIGTTQSVISRLEAADYEGHSLTMLQKIASAVGQRLEIRFAKPIKRQLQTAR